MSQTDEEIASPDEEIASPDEGMAQTDEEYAFHATTSYFTHTNVAITDTYKALLSGLS